VHKIHNISPAGSYTHASDRSAQAARLIPDNSR
jgi:hypothetical protein